eukprot:8047843-Alexandrium_andersonii.AAC.1
MGLGRIADCTLGTWPCEDPRMRAPFLQGTGSHGRILAVVPVVRARVREVAESRPVRRAVLKPLL